MELLTIQEPLRATAGLPAGLLTHCVTSGLVLALSATLPISEPSVAPAVWIPAQTD